MIDHELVVQGRQFRHLIARRKPHRELYAESLRLVQRDLIPVDMRTHRDRFPVSFPVKNSNRVREDRAPLLENRINTEKLSGGPPGIRTLNQWIKSPLLCR
jgi:hypothetical protein